MTVAHSITSSARACIEFLTHGASVSHAAREAGYARRSLCTAGDRQATFVVGRIFKANSAPVGSPWMWTLAFGHHEDRMPTHGYEATPEAAMAAFAKSWRQE
jgi:hypothetical protein